MKRSDFSLLQDASRVLPMKASSASSSTGAVPMAMGVPVDVESLGKGVPIAPTIPSAPIVPTFDVRIPPRHGPGSRFVFQYGGHFFDF